MRKEALFIYGSGSQGREIYDFALRLKEWREVYFVDDNPQITAINGRKVYRFKEVADECPANKCEFVIGSGEPRILKQLYEKVNSHGFKMAEMIVTNLKSNSLALKNLETGGG